MEGILKLKKDNGGNRHYIELPNGSHRNIHCGTIIEVQLGKWVELPGGEKLVPNVWIPGRYEADLMGDQPEAYLYIGGFYPDVGDMKCILPLGVKIRIPERKEAWKMTDTGRVFCEACNGTGEWWTECCNGAGGCSCRGEPVNMGRCNVCCGTGMRMKNADMRANSKAIQGYCFAGSGPSTGYWATRGARMNKA